MNIDTVIALCALLITAGGLLVTLGKIITTQSQLHDQGEEFKNILSDQGKTIVQVQLSMSSLRSEVCICAHAHCGVRDFDYEHTL